MPKKGISPIIAAVILIAITMAIAGFMSVWASNLTQNRLDEANVGARCIGAYEIDSLVFSSGTISFRVKNTAQNFNISDMRANLIYNSAQLSAENSNIELKGKNLSLPGDPLAPGTAAFFQITATDNATKPKGLTVSITECPRTEQAAEFR